MHWPSNLNAELAQQLALRVANGGQEAERLQAALGARFRPAGENAFWTFYDFLLLDGPFAGGEFRQEKAGRRARLNLRAREPLGVTQAEIDLCALGQPVDAAPSVDGFPDSAQVVALAVEGGRLAFQFEPRTRRLRALSREWGATRGHRG